MYWRGVQCLDEYLFTFYRQGGGDILIVTTRAGDYILADLLTSELEERVRLLLGKDLNERK